jgi:ABC-type Mn2+/Zn2+ transport system ATPase subunit
VIVSHDLRAVAAGCSSVACLNRTVHYHDVPTGLSEDLLREVFQHEISWVLNADRFQLATSTHHGDRESTEKKQKTADER